MQRPILAIGNIHPAIQNVVATSRQRLVQEVQAAIAAHPVVVVGMGMNPMCGNGRKALDTADAAHHYLEYGNYFYNWRDRNALSARVKWCRA